MRFFQSSWLIMSQIMSNHSAGVFGGVAVYTMHDIHFTVVGYVWLGVWYTFAVFEMVYVKKVVDTVEMTTWSRTYYQVPFSSINPVRLGCQIKALVPFLHTL